MLRDAVAGLDDRRFFRVLGGAHTGDLAEARIDTAFVVVVRTWSMHLNTSSGPMRLAVSWMPPVPQP